MTLSRELRGYLFAIGSNLASAIGSIACKVLIDATSVETTALMWFVAGGVLTFIVQIAFRGGIHPDSIRRNRRVYLQISLIMTVAALAWFAGLKLAGPNNVAFIAQLGIVMGVLMGAICLGERITLLDGIGGAVAMVGAMVITYRSGEAVILGVALTLINAFGWALQTLFVKQHIAAIDKLELVFVRSLIAASGVFVFSCFTGGLVWPTTWLLPAFFLGSAFGYVLVNLLIYRALDYADLAKVSMLSVIGPPTVMVCTFIVFGEIPSLQQFAGGFLILVGISLILVQPFWAISRTR